MNKLLTIALQNPHTSGSALAFGAVKVLSRIAKTWWPSHGSQIEATADGLESIAVLYFGVAAGDAAKSVSKQEADTTFVKKPNGGSPPTQP